MKEDQNILIIFHSSLYHSFNTKHTVPSLSILTLIFFFLANIFKNLKCFFYEYIIDYLVAPITRKN